MDTVEDYKYIDNKLGYLYRKGLYFLRRRRSFNICRTMLRMFYESVVASAILFAVVYWGSRLRVADANRLNKLIRKASDAVGVELDSLQQCQRGGRCPSFKPSWTMSPTHSIMNSAEMHHRAPQEHSLSFHRSLLQAFSQVLGVVAGSLAGGLNVLLQYVSHFLQAAGVQGGIPINKVTPEGLIFVVQWVLVALVSYWLLSLAFRLVASTVRRTLWLLKVSMAFACFGLILSDRSVETETMAIRLAILVCVCVLFGVGTSRSQPSSAADKTAHLEEQVRILERRLREMERWRRTEE
ncbi:transmembrane protein 109 [Morone saxatilis]|uniref:transmembrane protein 109 n=1 Tax=Morone saxatilis TaxID=34816 RepID=UPI0015E1F416|nr:transmembrane protein 109 [Morone saxatilis]